MPNASKLRSELYRVASLMGDIAAMQKGPEAMLKRMLRKTATKKSSKLINRVFK